MSGVTTIKVASVKRAMVIFASRYGNTEKIARSLEAGLKEAGIETACTSVSEVRLESLKEFELICVGAPTEWHTASKPMKEFLGKLKHVHFSGTYGFAFDTRLTRPLSGSAANLIEKELRNLGLRIITPRESATVFLQNGTVGGYGLKEGEERRFEQIGLRVGNELLAETRKEVILQ
jgi:flavorubredoxin